ncbi:MAG: plasmid replication protein, CyRepA1 family [Dolichospermum sp.]
MNSLSYYLCNVNSHKSLDAFSITQNDDNRQQSKTDFDIDLDKNLDTRHYQELKNSAISDSLIDSNFQSIHGEVGYELLLSDAIALLGEGKLVPHTDQYVTQDIKKYYKLYKHCLNGGWWCSGLDPLNNWEIMNWGCFKPDQPRLNQEGKSIKYEHPYKSATRAFFLLPGLHDWELIADKAAVAIGDYENFWLWVRDNKIPIIITEGAKKAAALLSNGYVAIGIPGIYNGHRKDKDSSKRYLIPELEVFADGRNFTIIFDNDSKQSAKINTEIASSQLGGLLRKKKCRVSIATWSYPFKGIDDLIVAHGQDTLDTVVQGAIALEDLEINKYYNLSYISKTLDKRYLGNIFKGCEGHRLVGVASGKGTGKTESLVSYVAGIIEKGYQVYLVSHRVQLCQDICRRLGLTYVDDRGSKSSGYGFVIDSFHKYGKCSSTITDTYSFLNDENCLPYYVIIDEVEQVLWHLLSSSTEVKSHRCEVISNFEKLVRNSNQVIALDADLTDVSMSYLKSSIGCSNDEILTIKNDYKGNGYEFFNYDQQTELVSEIYKSLDNGQKIFIATDSQKLSAKLSTQNLELLIRKKYPCLKILRIDSESIADSNNAACGIIPYLNEVISQYDIVLASPSIGTGVSIDIRGHFTKVFGIFKGKQSENSVRQMLMRVRENIPRHIYVAKRGMSKIGTGESSARCLFSSSEKMFQLHLKSLQSDNFELINNEININLNALNCYLKMAARINFEMSDYRNIVTKNLINEGNELVFNDGDGEHDVEQIDIELTENKEENYLNELDEIIETDVSTMTQEQFKHLDKQKLKTKNERHKHRKYQVQDLYKVDVTADLLHKDNEGYYPQLRLHYFLSLGRKFSLLRDNRILDKVVELKSAFYPDINQSLIESRVKLLELLNIPDILALDKITSSHELLMVLKDTILAYPKEIKMFLGGFHPDMTPVAMLRKIIKLLGLKLQRIGRQGTGDRNWIYKVVGLEDGRGDIFHKWESVDAAKYLEIENEKCIDMIPNPSKNLIYINEGKLDGKELDVTEPGLCLFQDLTTGNWIEGIAKTIQTLANGTFKAVVEFGDGLTRVLWSPDHLILAGGEV